MTVPRVSSARVVLALMRASIVSASSYRLGFAFSVAGLLFSVVPIYYVTHAMQPLMAGAIASQGDDYFSFFVVGMMVLQIIPSALQVLPTTLNGSINSGVLESLLGTPASLPAVLTGLIGYELAWAVVRAATFLLLGVIAGVRLSITGFLPGLFVLAVIVLGYLAMGAVFGAMIVAYRTTGPLVTGVLGLTTLLGGTYFPTHVIPTWVAGLSKVIPLTYGLRALRRLWLEGLPVRAVAEDILVLCALTGMLVAVGVWSLRRTITTARKRGTLAQY